MEREINNIFGDFIFQYIKNSIQFECELERNYQMLIKKNGHYDR